MVAVSPQAELSRKRGGRVACGQTTLGVAGRFGIHALRDTLTNSHEYRGEKQKYLGTWECIKNVLSLQIFVSSTEKQNRFILHGSRGQREQQREVTGK